MLVKIIDKMIKLHPIFCLLIPVISVAACRLLRVAQGEKTEEIISGIMIGIVLDLLFSVTLLIAEKLKDKASKN